MCNGVSRRGSGYGWVCMGIDWGVYYVDVLTHAGGQSKTSY